MSKGQPAANTATVSPQIGSSIPRKRKSRDSPPIEPREAALPKQSMSVTLILATEESLDVSNNVLLRTQETTTSTRSTNKNRLKSVIEVDCLMMKICWPRFVLALCQGSTDLWNCSDLLAFIIFVYNNMQDDDTEGQIANSELTEDASEGDHGDEVRKRKEDECKLSDHKAGPELVNW